MSEQPFLSMAENLPPRDITGRINRRVKHDPSKRRVMELKVWQLRVRRYTWPEIGEALGVPRSTAQWLYACFEKRNDTLFMDLERGEVLREMLDAAKQRLQTLDALYRDAKQHNVKLSVINSMRAEMEHVKEMLHDFGDPELNRPPMKLEHVGTVAELIALAQREQHGVQDLGHRLSAHLGN